MRKILGLLLIFVVLACENSQERKFAEFSTPFEENGGDISPTYEEVIDFYLALAKEYSTLNIQTIGSTDSGQPLHLVTFNPESEFNFQRIRDEKLIVLINNGIHPGEPDGIDASMILFRDLCTGKIDRPEKVVIAAIPVYNIGGALNRNSTSRVNQNGPQIYGFRGNARNYDLNRDFIKTDTQNAQTFTEIFHLLDPHIFIDTHVSNGADYQYVLTHLFTQHNKLGGRLGALLENTLRPQFEKELLEEGWDITPYVNVYNSPPDNGFSQFLDHPRYSTGYAALWQTPGLMIETHMLKPYADRVHGTLIALQKIIEVAEENNETIKENRILDREYYSNLKYYPVNWQVDTTSVSKLKFKGFQADTTMSEVTGLPRLRYLRDRPIERLVPYKSTYVAMDSVEIPQVYILKKSRKDILDKLIANGISYEIIGQDTTINVISYRIDQYKTRTQPYEGHYLHYNTSVEKVRERVKFNVGDFWIPTKQPGVRYLIEVLEPAAVDSFFNWNFFDAILQQKEGFSPYVFEDLAFEILNADTELKAEFENKKLTNPDFKNNAYWQLDWIYKRSPYYEKEHRLYPVYKLMRGVTE